MVVFRVHWLRAKCQAERANEELTLVRKEMGWVPLYFRHEANSWTQWLIDNPNGSTGRICYAKKQKSLWTELARSAVEAFASRLGTVL